MELLLWDRWQEFGCVAVVEVKEVDAVGVGVEFALAVGGVHDSIYDNSG